MTLCFTPSQATVFTGLAEISAFQRVYLVLMAAKGEWCMGSIFQWQVQVT